MPQKDPRVDAYIAKSQPFARPILTEIRKRVHAACPAVEETLKWGMPSFLYKGILCGMAAFKAHCTFGFWHKAMQGKVKARGGQEAMGQCGRMTSVKDLPSKALFAKLVKEAMALADAGIPAIVRSKTKKPPPKTPVDLAAALARNRRAAETFEAFAPSCRREYVEWITEARREETRAKRVATAVAWMAEGKKRNWKYERC